MSATPERDKSAGIDIPWPLVREEDLQVIIEDNLRGKPLREIVLDRLIADCNILSGDEILSGDQKQMINGAQTFFSYLGYIFKYVADGSYQRVSDVLAGITPGDLSYSERMNDLDLKLSDIYPGLNGISSNFNKFELVMTEFEDGNVLIDDPKGFGLVHQIVNKQIMGGNELLREGVVLAEERYKRLYDNLESLGLQQGVQTDHKLAS